ncbi:esterase/lipase family protein [Flavisphingomonas formosensis]|uniref:esterase/lipase family protein n=1 Tax=Flavisphingomonas formosensis TaxID=861534 RepID=UPI0012FA7B00|nr:alpha/beta hydrolase [Sphingomonas formosensis]
MARHQIVTARTEKRHAVASSPATARFAPAVVRGRGQPVMVIPGFLATDLSTVLMRRALEQAGYRAYGWRMGINFGTRADTLVRLSARLDQVRAEAGEPVALVGWSLGGLFARELAKERPDAVTRVITMGSPFSGDPRGNRVWRLYELIARHPVDAPPLPVNLPEKPPVQTVAIWSARDGVIDPACARGETHERDAAIEVGCSHLGMVRAPDALAAMIGALAG